MSNKFTAVSQAWATHSPWLPEEINSPTVLKKMQEARYWVTHPVLLTVRRAPFLGFPSHKPSAAFLAPVCPRMSLGGGERQSALFSYNYKHIITFLNAYFKWRQLIMTYIWWCFSWSTEKYLKKRALLRLGSMVVIEELCCSYKFYFNFSWNSSLFSLCADETSEYRKYHVPCQKSNSIFKS